MNENKSSLQRHRETWIGKSDEWLFERLNNELKSKVEEIHRLLEENKSLQNKLNECEKELSETKTRLHFLGYKINPTLVNENNENNKNKIS